MHPALGKGQDYGTEVLHELRCCTSGGRSILPELAEGQCMRRPPCPRHEAHVLYIRGPLERGPGRLLRKRHPQGSVQRV